MMIHYLRISFLFVFISAAIATAAQNKSATIDLSGQWRFATDSLDKGIAEKWFRLQLQDHITLPGSMTTNDKGNPIDINTPWTGQIVDSSWFTAPEYKAYRQPGNIKIPFWLQPV
ncbi:MAG: beta-glucuronidase, partial [Chitinophagaceae bacterium]|nr:beta-glucuronidase [Chitinophagaceae bacterium]